MASTDVIKGRLNVAINRNTSNNGQGSYFICLSDSQRKRQTVRLSFHEAARLWQQLDRMLVSDERFLRFRSQ